MEKENKRLQIKEKYLRGNCNDSKVWISSIIIISFVRFSSLIPRYASRLQVDFKRIC